MSAQKTEAERSVHTLVKVFFDYAKKEGKDNTLSFSEFSQLVTKEFPHMLKDVSLEAKMKELDINKDNELAFYEFWRLTGELAKGVQKDLKAKK
uniref:S100/CaBP-9k-type calcium binding subdomain domain-containing protein n=1 Tax=Leptobrachium leishanense TaxID=445787 RepID=A0A8C5Q222_9ANUR